MLAALGWGALAASSLLLGVALAFARRWPVKWVGLVLAFGAGALISAISFELALEGAKAGGLGVTAIGLAIGALTYFFLDGVIARRFAAGRGRPGRAPSSAAGPARARRASPARRRGPCARARRVPGRRARADGVGHRAGGGRGDQRRGPGRDLRLQSARGD